MLYGFTFTWWKLGNAVHSLQLSVHRCSREHDADRATLARRQVFLPSAAGGLGPRHFGRLRPAFYAAASYDVWPTLTATLPAECRRLWFLELCEIYIK